MAQSIDIDGRHHQQTLSSREFDALFALGENFFHQGRLEKAYVIFDGLSVLSQNDHRPKHAKEHCLKYLEGAKKVLAAKNSSNI